MQQYQTLRSAPRRALIFEDDDVGSKVAAVEDCTVIRLVEGLGGPGET